MAWCHNHAWQLTRCFFHASPAVCPASALQGLHPVRGGGRGGGQAAGGAGGGSRCSQEQPAVICHPHAPRLPPPLRCHGGRRVLLCCSEGIGCNRLNTLKPWSACSSFQPSHACSLVRPSLPAGAAGTASLLPAGTQPADQPAPLCSHASFLDSLSKEERRIIGMRVGRSHLLDITYCALSANATAYTQCNLKSRMSGCLSPCCLSPIQTIVCAEALSRKFREDREEGAAWQHTQRGAAAQQSDQAAPHLQALKAAGRAAASSSTAAPPPAPLAAAGGTAGPRQQAMLRPASAAVTRSQEFRVPYRLSSKAGAASGAAGAAEGASTQGLLLSVPQYSTQQPRP